MKAGGFRDFEYLRYKGDWLENMRGALMVVATVTTTITYQPALLCRVGQIDINDKVNYIDTPDVW